MAKLVDILARDLPIWPAHADGLQQSIGGTIYYAPKGSLSIQKLCIMEKASDWRHGYVTRDQWEIAGKILLEKRALEQKQKTANHQAVQEGATHWSPADNEDGRVEAYWRPDWKGGYDCWAVTSRPDGNKWQKGSFELPDYAIALPVWNGEGLPPVGTVCEFMNHKSPPAQKGQWTVGDIRYVSDCTIIIGGDKCEHVHYPRNCSFRPIRTPEQIAAEDRDKELNKELNGMVATCSMPDKEWVRKVCASLYDAGYRKPINPTSE